MSDPYQLLGVAADASDEDVTKAYRRLAKKYHPDINPGPESEKKMQEINAAYQQIQDMRKNGGSAGGAQGAYYGQSTDYGRQGTYQDPFGRSYNGGQNGGTYYGEYDPFGFRSRQENHQDFTDVKLRAAANYIRTQSWEEALHVLSEISTRDGQWYYLSALANAGAGNRVTAMNHAQEACRQEPNNMEYRNLLARFQQGNFNYQQAQQEWGFQSGVRVDPMCALCGAYWLCQMCACGRGGMFFC